MLLLPIEIRLLRHPQSDFCIERWTKEKMRQAEEGKGYIRMISIKKYLEATPDALLISTQAAYRSALLSFAKAAVQAIPLTSHDLHHSLTAVEAAIAPAISS